jgi:hypothetical protein
MPRIRCRRSSARACARDVQNIAFKLDLVQRGRADESLFATYQTEREPHVRAVIEKGIELGRMQTIRDPARAAARDRELMARRAAAEAPDKIRFPGLGPGMVTTGGGSLSVQGAIDDGRHRGRLDQVAGAGFQFVVAPAALPGLGDRVDALRRAGVVVSAPGRQAGPAPLVLDVDGIYAAWFAELDCEAVAVRPDFYVFGTASGRGVAALADGLLAAMGPAPAADPVVLSAVRQSA